MYNISKCNREYRKTHTVSVCWMNNKFVQRIKIRIEILGMTKELNVGDISVLFRHVCVGNLCHY